MISNSTRTLYIVVLTVFAFSLGLSLLFVFKSSPGNGSMALTANAVAVYKKEKTDIIGLPIRLRIPKINVDATIEQVGITPEGAMDVPKGASDAAWLNLGPHPGEPGSAVMAGHSGWKDNKAAVFDNLYKLQNGDKIYVQDKKGVTVTFVVREFRKYNLRANPDEVFYSNDGISHLNLITCSGFWDESKRTHSSRLVVFADKEKE